jgi:uncharacterized protein
MVNKHREYQVFVKPVGAACNLRCSYCYYNVPVADSAGTRAAVMQDDTLEQYIKQNIEAAGRGPVNFAWHGGEPTLAGVSFYRRAVALQREYSRPGVVITNGIQTNGTLIDDEWCRFLATGNFAVGISIDGPGELHDYHRKKANGRGSFSAAVTAFLKLREYGLEPEIMCVVSEHNAGSALEIYNYFKALGAKWITFLPLVVKNTSKAGGVTPESVTPEKFGQFLCTIFDEWVEKDIGKIKVQIFEEAARVAFKMEHTLCIFKRECGGVPVVEKNGDFYSCDHFVTPEYKVGNINDRSLSELLDSEAQKSFGAAKRNSLPQYCLDCEVLDMCNGECPKNRFIQTPAGEPGLNYLCRGYRMFFNHVRPFVEAISKSY